MNVTDYLASGGLERLLLIGAAILITYWGYHLYGKAQIAGLAMIAVAALLLMSVVLTSGSHQQAANTNLVAALPAPAPDSEPVLSMQPAPVELPAELVSDPIEAPVNDEADSPFVEAAAEPVVEAVEPIVEATEPEVLVVDVTDSEPPSEATDSAEPDRIERLVPLASGQELGGRITSVRSENVTLEWSEEDPRRRIISASSTP